MYASVYGSLAVCRTRLPYVGGGVNEKSAFSVIVGGVLEGVQMLWAGGGSLGAPPKTILIQFLFAGLVYKPTTNR